MTYVFVFAALAIVFAIAAVVVGREARRLDAVAPAPTFDLEEATEWVANHLPYDVSAVLSYAEVRRLLDWSLEFLRSKGVSGNGSAPTVEGVDVVVGGTETVAYVLARATEAGEAYTPEQVHAVLDAQLGYLEAIGAVGPQAPPPHPAA